MQDELLIFVAGLALGWSKHACTYSLRPIILGILYLHNRLEIWSSLDKLCNLIFLLLSGCSNYQKLLD